MLNDSSKEWHPTRVIGPPGHEWDVPEFSGRGYAFLDTTLQSITCQDGDEGTTVILTLRTDDGDICQLAFDRVWDLTLNTAEDPPPLDQVWGQPASCDKDNVDYFFLRTFVLDLEFRSSSQRFRWLKVSA